MERPVGIYLRVSSRSQDHAAQLPDLERWAKSHEGPIRWYRDKATGKNMSRPGWEKLERDLLAGELGAIIVWRLDRLGRTCSGLTQLFELLIARKVGLVSIRDGLDLSTPAGRLMAHVLASVAQYETEVRSERQAAGIRAARAKGKRWGGSKPGRRKATVEKQALIRKLKAEGQPIARIADMLGLSRPSVYRVLSESA